MLYHVYASLDEAKRYLRDEGEAWGSGSTNDALALRQLASVSRRVDDWCRRSAFGSGFGPRLGTNRYDAAGGSDLFFRDDLIETTSVVSRALTAATDSVSPAADDDYYLTNQQGTYEPGPFRRAVLHGQGTVAAFGRGYRVLSWTGSWGYEDRTLVLTAALAAAVADAEITTVSVDALVEFSPGQTLRIDDEQVYVEDVTESEDEMTPPTITVVRGVNGTIAAAHADESAVELFRYDPRVVDATLRVFGRRWRARTSGADGSDGNGDIGMVTPREGEDLILRRAIGELRLMGSVVF